MESTAAEAETLPKPLEELSAPKPAARLLLFELLATLPPAPLLAAALDPPAPPTRESLRVLDELEVAPPASEDAENWLLGS